MSRQIRDEHEYGIGSKWFARWHRDQPEDDARMIDLDGVGYCGGCLDPIYLIEATRARNKKNATVTEHLGRKLNATVWVCYQDKSGEHYGEILVDDRTTGVNHGWLPENKVWEMLLDLRRTHECTESGR